MEKSTQETVKNEKVKPEKELRDGLSQLRDEESLGTIGDDMEDVHDEAIREVLAKDQVEGKWFVSEDSLLIFFFIRGFSFDWDDVCVYQMFEKIHLWSQMIKM